MERQCILQLLPLPCELISIIKDYVFYTKIEKQARNTKKNIMKIIKYSFCKKLNRNKINMNIFLFWSNHHKDPQFQILFCRCGNYRLLNTLQIPEKIKCQCF
jgi:hypothetical protein